MELVFNNSQRFQITTQLLELINHLAFLANGIFPTVSMRAAQAFMQQKDVQGTFMPKCSYMSKQLLWNRILVLQYWYFLIL